MDEAAAQSDVRFSSDQAVQHRIAAAVPLQRTWYGAPFFCQCLSLLGFVCFQTPWYILRWLVSLVQLPAFLVVGSTPTDQDIVDLIEGSGICMLLSKAQDSSHSGSLLKWEFQHCQLICSGKKLQSLSIVYRKGSHGNRTTRQGADIICCMRNGEVVTSREQIYATLMAYFSVSLHPKMHVMGANLISMLNKTTDKHAANLLSVCKYNTTPLHIFLMHTPFSPLGNSWLSRYLGTFDMCVDKLSFTDEAVNMADMVNHKNKLDLVLSLDNSFTTFLVHSRDVLLKTMKKHGIDLKLFEMLWLHSIVHALDHHAVSKLALGRKMLFGIINIWQDSSTYSRIRTFLFLSMFVQEVLSPLPWVSNRMRDVAKGYGWVAPVSPGAVAFWSDLYASLHDLDAELASHMTCSIMY